MNPRPLTAIAVLFCVCVLAAASSPAQAQTQDPTRTEVPLPAAAGWNASLVHATDVGVWALGCFQLFPQYGCPEVVAMDDRGRCTLLVSYSGKFTPMETIHDGAWLGAAVWLDLDPTREGPELYTGGQRGRLYQIHPRRAPGGGVDTRIVGNFPGHEIHTLIGGKLDTASDEPVLLIFFRPGKLVALRPGAGPTDPFVVTPLGKVPGRIRFGVPVGDLDGKGPQIAVAGRAGLVALCRLQGTEVEWQEITREPMGFGRLAFAPAAHGRPHLLYATRDDGVVLRFARQADGGWKREVIFAGPQGPRGLVAGRFHADPAVETVAVFGYSKKVHFLSRRGSEPWKVETIFTAADKGHALAVVELDGRNATQEIIGSGYGNRVFMLARPPGYGLTGVPAAPESAGAKTKATFRVKRTVKATATATATVTAKKIVTAKPKADPNEVRLGLTAKAPPISFVTPLKYGGGFEVKTLALETLVMRDAAGRIAPGLAASWEIADGGRTYLFTLRPGAKFHDGTAVDARAVISSFRRWVGFPQHGWLGASRFIREMKADPDGRLRITLSRPYALLPDLCAINPCSILGPGSWDRHGNYLKPVGSGPFRFVETRDNGRVFVYQRVRPDGTAGRRISLTHAIGDGIAALRGGLIDVFAETWENRLPRSEIETLAKDPAFRLTRARGSSVVHVNLNFQREPLRDSAARHHVRAVLQGVVARLILAAEYGHADPCGSFAAEAVGVWPRSRWKPPTHLDHEPMKLTLLARADHPWEMRLARAITQHSAMLNLAVKIEAVDAASHSKALAQGAWDLWIDRSWAVPYDPFITLVARFARPPEAPSAGSHRAQQVSVELARLVETATASTRQTEREQVYRKIQDVLDEEALLVPLYVPRRFTLVRKGLAAPALGADLYRIPAEVWTDTR